MQKKNLVKGKIEQKLWPPGLYFLTPDAICNGCLSYLLMRLGRQESKAHHVKPPEGVSSLLRHHSGAKQGKPQGFALFLKENRLSEKALEKLLVYGSLSMSKL